MRFELDHIVLSVRDMDAMLRFYLDVIGLQPHRVDEYRAGTALFPCARIDEGTLVDLLPEALWNFGGSAPGEGGAGVFPNMNHFCLALGRDDWEPLMARLAAAGVAVEIGPVLRAGARGDGMAVYVRDPEGNQLELRHY